MHCQAVYLGMVLCLVYLLSSHSVDAECLGQNEIFACGSACDTTCATLGQTCPIVNIQCNQMCYCKVGFARNANGVCIPVDQCPPQVCNEKNEEFTNCGTVCPPSCKSIRAAPGSCIAMCVEGCFCKPGFVKNDAGSCVRPTECPE